MPSLHNAQLTVAPDYSLTRATLTVECDVQFTEFEVNAMNKLGLRYVLGCRVVNKDLWYVTTSAVFADVELPRSGRAAVATEHVELQMIAPIAQLREHMFTLDEFLAELTLRDCATGAEQVARTPLVSVDLAA